MAPTSRPDVLAAAGRVVGLARRSAAEPSQLLSEMVGAPVVLKREDTQPTGSFKVRGAASRIRAMSDDEARRGVVTASTGNHGRAVAHVAGRLGIRAAVCVSVNVPAGKVAALEETGCEVHVGGASQTEAFVTAERLVAEDGMVLIHPFDDLDVIAGQGTIGLEIAEDVPDAATVLVPLSGGGLAAGIAAALDEVASTVRVVGVSMERAPVMAESLAAGRPVELDEQPTLADSLQGGIGTDNAHTFRLCRELLDDVVLVGEEDIWRAMHLAVSELGIVLEGAGAVPIAALLSGAVTVRGTTVAVCSGANAEGEDVRVLTAAGPGETPPLRSRA